MRKWLLGSVVGMSLAAAGCASSTELYQRAESLSDGQPYAEISIKPDAVTRAMPLKVSSTGQGRPNDWHGFVVADSGGATVAKGVYSMTPWGMATNLIHGKPVIGMETVYRVPAGVVHLLVFNYYRRDIAGTNEFEKGSWGTILTAQVCAGKRYRLVPTVMEMPASQFKEVPAFTSLVDKDGAVVSQYSIFQPSVAEGTREGPSFTERWNKGISKAARGDRFAWVDMSQALASEIAEFNAELGRFREAMEADSR